MSRKAWRLGLLLASAAIGMTVLPAVCRAQLSDELYPRRPVHPAILAATQARHEQMLEDISFEHRVARSAEPRLARMSAAERTAWISRGRRSAWVDQPQTVEEQRRAIQEMLGIDSLVVRGEVKSRTAWTWWAPWKTKDVEIDGQLAPRTSRKKLGLYEQVVIRGPYDRDISLLLIHPADAPRPASLVVCLPEYDAATTLAQRKEDVVRSPLVQEMVRSQHIVAIPDLPALANLSERAWKRGLLEGHPSLGQIVDELHTVVAHLAARDDAKPSRIAVYGRGLSGFAAVLAAAIDARIWAVAVEDALPSFRTIIERGEELEGEWLVPGFLRWLDEGQLARLAGPRPLLIRASSAPRWRETLAHPLLRPQPVFGENQTLFTQAVDDGKASSGADGALEVARFLKDSLVYSKQSWEPLRWRPYVIEAPRPVNGLSLPISIDDLRDTFQWNTAREIIERELWSLLHGESREHGAEPRAPFGGRIIELDHGLEDGFAYERLIVETTHGTLMPVVITRAREMPDGTPQPALIHLSGYSISHEQDALRLAGEMAEHGFIGVFACAKTATGFRLGGTPQDHVAILMGGSILGEWTDNLMGLVDYLETRGDIDAERIGAMGWSMGATMLSYWAPFDRRIKAAAGFVAFNQWRGLMEEVRTEAVTGGDGTSYLEGHPTYNFVPGLLAVCDVDDLWATFAPRPFVSLAGEKDEYFPHQVVRDAFFRQSRIYQMLGIEDRYELLVYPGKHDLAPPLRDKAWALFERWLK